MQKYSYILILMVIFSCATDQKSGNNKTIIKKEIENVVSTLDTIANIDTIAKDSIKEIMTNNVKNAQSEAINNKHTNPKPTITKAKVGSIYFGAPIHEFGRITEGDTVAHTFVFENRGNGDLTIKDVLVDCGCTVPRFPKQSIAPGGTGTIEVTFNSKGKIASQERFITVLSNGEPRSKIIKLKGIVDTE